MSKQRLLWLALASLFVASIGSCRRERATREACAEILDRIVEVELEEQGFRDTTLAARKKEEMRRLLEPELRLCVNAKLSADATECLRKARSTEEISHFCLP